MADKSAQADIRGLDVDSLIRGFADQAFVLKNFVRKSSTSAREIRWFQKTAGVLDSTDTTAITASQIANTSSGSLPVVVEPQWTRNSSYVKKYFVESQTLTIEDLKDNDVDMLATCISDLVRAVAYQVDSRIYTVISDTLGGGSAGIQTAAATQDGWDDVATGDPILDLLKADEKIKEFNYDTSELVLYINQVEYRNLMHNLISVKGSSIPNFSSKLVERGVLMGLLNFKIVSSPNATTDYALVFVQNVSGTWKSFTPLTHAVKNDEGIGKKIRVWEEGEALLTDPKSVYLITDTVT